MIEFFNWIGDHWLGFIITLWIVCAIISGAIKDARSND